jgi:sugar phosphate isomerase/epimerase
MEIGYRIIRPRDVGTQPLLFAQISLWQSANWGVAEGEQAVTQAIAIASACTVRRIRTIFHPLEYPLANEHADRTMGVMRRLAAASDLGIIIHDEGGPDGKGLSPVEGALFEKNLAELGRLCPVSIENAFNSGDITRFWERFVVPAPKNVSITVDIGHLESADIDAIAFVRDLPQRLMERVNFVHMHHKDKERYGIKDHWPLVAGCREIEALKELLKRRPDVRVVLELDTSGDGLRQSIELLKDL